MVKRNEFIRKKIKDFGLKQYMVAEKLGIHETTFILWLRRELTEEKKELIIGAIEELNHELNLNHAVES